MHLPRWLHRVYARLMGYFWMPCPACGREFGGHEWRQIDGHFAAIVTDSGDPWGICPDCTARGVGCRSHAHRFPNWSMYHLGCCYEQPPWTVEQQDQIRRDAAYYRARHQLAEDTRPIFTWPGGTVGEPDLDPDPVPRGEAV